MIRWGNFIPLKQWDRSPTRLMIKKWKLPILPVTYGDLIDAGFEANLRERSYAFASLLKLSSITGRRVLSFPLTPCLTPWKKSSLASSNSSNIRIALGTGLTYKWRRIMIWNKLSSWIVSKAPTITNAMLRRNRSFVVVWTHLCKDFWMSIKTLARRKRSNSIINSLKRQISSKFSRIQIFQKISIA